MVCKDTNAFNLARKLKWFGYDRDAIKDEKGEWRGQRWSADIKPGEVGFKFNMNNISAAIGIAQMSHIGDLLDAHRTNGATYNEEFCNSKYIKPLPVPSGANSSYWVYTCLYLGVEKSRDELIERLNAEGIAAGLVHLPNDIYSAFEDFKVDLPGTTAFSTSQISLPCGWWISPEDCRFIASRLLDIASQLD